MTHGRHSSKKEDAKIERHERAKSKRVTCPDCGATYAEGALHGMFCAAHTCSECQTTYGYSLMKSGKDDEGNETRICEKCLTELDGEEFKG